MSTIKTDKIIPIGSTLSVEGATVFTAGISANSTMILGGGATLSSTLNVSGATTLTTATTGLITCATAPTAAGHLCNKTYVDDFNFTTGTYVVYALVLPTYGALPTASARGSYSPPYTTATTRGSGVQYTSPVGSTVLVQGICDRNSGLSVIVGGVEIRWAAAGNIGENFNFIVPPNTTYKVTAASGIGGWTEFIS